MMLFTNIGRLGLSLKLSRPRTSQVTCVIFILTIVGVILLLRGHHTPNRVLHSEPSYHSFNISAMHLDSPDIFNMIPDQFLPGYRNFCWRSTESGLYCLPSVYLGGIPKCGSTDIHKKLAWHHDVISSIPKEYHYWTTSRLGNQYLPWMHFTSYLDKFRSTEELTKSSLIVDGSQSLMWNLVGWQRRFPWATEPPYTTADLIYTLTPAAKVLVAVRDPVRRLYSDYLYFGRESENRTPDSFSRDVAREIDHFNRCLATGMSLRWCCYDESNSNKVRLSVGIYICFIRDWKIRFGDNLLVIHMEEYASSPVETMLGIYRFLGLSQPNEQDLRYFIENSPKENSRHKWDISKGDMFEETALLLQEFYSKYNRELATFLNDDRVLYGYS